MSEIATELQALQDDFDILEDPLEQLAYVRDLGRALPPLGPGEMTEANFLKGCSSAAWLLAEPLPDGRLRFRGYADAIIPRGVVALLLKLYSDRTPADILSITPSDAMARLGLSQMLSMNRVSGLAAMGARIQREALRAQADQPMP